LVPLISFIALDLFGAIKTAGGCGHHVSHIMQILFIFEDRLPLAFLAGSLGHFAGFVLHIALALLNAARVQQPPT
jgi:hypothetical protein